MNTLKLTKGKETIVDNEDFELLNKHKWYCSHGYAVRNIRLPNGKQKNIRMHRFLINAPDDMQIDHINGNRLDNRRENLRLATNSQNAMNQGKRKNNTSGFKGVSWHKPNKKWLAHIRLNSKTIHLGLYTTRELAYAAYCDACVKLHGEFAHL